MKKRKVSQLRFPKAPKALGSKELSCARGGLGIEIGDEDPRGGNPLWNPRLIIPCIRASGAKIGSIIPCVLPAPGLLKR
jgi:hypothetical protein